MLTIAIDDTTLFDDLCWHFSRSGFLVARLKLGAVQVSRPDAPTQGQGRREVALHLAVWRAMNPAVGVAHPHEADVATERYALSD
jgi:hypothetical protein